MNACLYWSTARPASPAACRFISAEDWLSLCLSAYYAASRDLAPPPGEPWIIEGVTWAGPQDFASGLEHHVVRRLHAAAIAAGVCHEADDDDGPDAPDEPEGEPGRPAGASGHAAGPGVAGAAPPPVMGHGWPALLGAGSAAAGLPEAVNAANPHREDRASPDDRLSSPGGEGISDISTTARGIHYA